MIDVSKILEIIKDPDLKLKINELYGENISLKEENSKLRRKIEVSNKTDEIKDKLFFEENHYYIKENENKVGPYCTKCWDSENKLIRLHDGGTDSGRHFFECPNCKTVANTGHYENHTKNWAEDY